MRNKKYLGLALLSFFLVGCTDKTPESSSRFTLTDIALSEESIDLAIGETKRLTIANPDLALAVRWTSSESSICSVDEYGFIRGIKEGKATITADYGSLSSSCEIHVLPSANGLPTLQWSETNLFLKQGNAFDVYAHAFFNGKDYDTPFRFTLSDPDIASMNIEDNKVTVYALKEGKTDLVASIVYEGKTIYASLPIQVSEISVSFEITNATPKEGGYEKTISLRETFTPEYLVYVDGVLDKDASLVWSFSDEEMLALEGDSTIKPLKEGKAEVYGNYNNLATVLISLSVIA